MKTHGVLMLALAGCATLPKAPPPIANGPGQKAYYATSWSFGAAESAALSQQAYGALTRYVAEQLPATSRPGPVTSALVSAIAGGAPQRAPCSEASKAHPAVIFDIDETSLLNIGIQYHQAVTGAGYNDADWSRWEHDRPGLAVPVPGIVAAVAALRQATPPVTPIWISNGSSANAAATARALQLAGLGDAVHLQTLFLSGDIAPGSSKEPRRQYVAQTYCVLAQVGDQVSDFTDLIDFAPGSTAKRTLLERRATASESFAGLWGQGWFVLPNPIYGPWNRPEATLDDAVPPGLRWPKP